MSEFPITPALGQKASQETNNTEHYTYTSSEFARDINMNRYQRAQPEERLNLKTEESVDPSFWDDKAPSTIEAPVEAVAPKTRAQEIEEPLFYLPHSEQVAYGANITRAVIAIRRAA